MIAIVAMIGALVLSAVPAWAQDMAPGRSAAESTSGELDWEMSRDGRGHSMAFIPTTTGLAIGIRCNSGNLSAIIGGLPPAPGEEKTRVINIGFDDHDPRPWRFNVTIDRSVAMADFPASLARALRTGGRTRIGIPGGAPGGRNLRHDLTLPGSSAAIDTIMRNCHRPLVDSRDDQLPDIPEGGLPSDLVWAVRPQPSYPMGSNYYEGFAVLTCLSAADGGLHHCIVESENPPDARFGRAAINGARSARLANAANSGTPVAPRIVAFRVNFARLP